MLPRRNRCFLLFALAFAALPGQSSRCLQAQVPTRDEVDQAKDIPLSDDPAAIIAVVGDTPILVGDLMPKVDARIKDVLAKTGQEVPKDQLHYVKVNLMRGLLAQAIQNKMMRESFLIDQVGTQAADKRAEADEKLTSRARQMFFESEVPELKDQYKVADLTELDKILREKGSSLSARQRDFIDQMLGHLYIRANVDREPNVTFSEILEYYEENKASYEKPTRARWEQLSILFSKHPDKTEARALIAEMGREAYFGGNVQAVAREKSEEPFGPAGGVHDWTTKGALASDELDKNIFSLPLNALSEIIEDSDGFHIIRILERTEAGVVAVKDIQDEIRATIRQQKIAKSQRNVLENMQKRIPVWSLFEQDIPNAMPLPEKLASRHATPTSIR